MKRLFSISFLLICAIAVGQNQLGLHHGNYNGATGILKNPASFQLSNMRWDFVVLSGGAFVENEYAYIKDATVPKLLSGNYDLVEGTEGAPANTNTRHYQFYDANKPMHNSANAFAGYPSFVGRINRTVSMGLFSRSRMGFSANYLDPLWSQPKLNNWPYGEMRTADPIWAGAMLWSEVGLNMAKGLKLGNNPLAIGVNVKFLVGHEAVYTFVPNNTIITPYQTHYLAFTQEARFGFTDFENNALNPVFKGAGLGVDIGFVYQHRKPNGTLGWQAEVSVVDVGAIRFTRAQNHHVTTTTPQTLQRTALEQIESLDDFATTVSYEVMGSPTASLVGSDFTMITPAGMIASLEYWLSEKWIIEGELGRRLVLSPRQVYRDKYVALSARYQTKWFEVGMPLVLHNDRDLRVGTWLRIGPVVLGSDHITTWFINQQQLTGTDFYFALRVNSNTFKRGSRRGVSHQKSNPEACYW